MGKLPRLCLALLAICLASTLHIPSHRQANTLASVISQKSQLETMLTSIVSTLTSLQPSSASDTAAKAFSLDTPINTASQSSPLISPFQVSTSACKQATAQQVQSLSQSVTAAQTTLQQTQASLSTLPASTQTTTMGSDLSNDQLLLASVSKIFASGCNTTVELTQSIFQSNLNAPGWIMGAQSLADVVEGYYARTQKYVNITNCPLANPFFDGSKCIAVTSPNVFNILTKKVELCPAGSALSNPTHSCTALPLYSNLVSAGNVLYDNTTAIPPPSDPTAIPCPAATPFYDGKTCVVCSLPSYWSVVNKACLKCADGSTFDINLDVCTVVTPPALTVLQGTNWVTPDNNVTAVLASRAKLLSMATTPPIYCPTATPYYDGVTCINCPHEFDLTTNQCTIAPVTPVPEVYDPNVHGYIPITPVSETVSTAPNLLTSTPLTDNPAVKNCPTETPYWDGIGCITCPAPFILFDVTSKTCGACAATQFYNATTQSCVDKPVILVSSNVANLMAAPNQTVPAYKAGVATIISSPPPNTIVTTCPNPTDYSNGTNCFPCASPAYFNVGTATCQNCSLGLDPVTLLCIQTLTMQTNLDTAPNVDVPNDTLNKAYFQQLQANVAGAKAFCAAPTPYAVANNTCINCSTTAPYFDINTKTCITAPSNSVYNSTTLQFTPCPTGTVAINNTCTPAQYITNTANTTNNYIQVLPNATLANVTNPLTYPKGTVLISCPVATPFFNGTNCVACAAPTPLFNLATNKCQACPAGSNLINATCIHSQFITNANVTGNYIEQLPNGTLANDTNPLSYPPGTQLVSCPAATPFSNGVACVACNSSAPYFNFGTNKCQACPAGSTLVGTSCSSVPQQITNPAATNYIQTAPNSTLANITSPSSYPAGTKLVPCPIQTPYFNGKACIACTAPTPYFDLASNKCLACPTGTTYNSATFQCIAPVTATSTLTYTNLENPNWIVNSGTSVSTVLAPVDIASEQNGSIQCPIAFPFYNSVAKACVSCPTGALYNFDANQCQTCPAPNIVNSLTKVCGPNTPTPYQTSLSSPNLIYSDIPAGSYQNTYTSNIAANPNIKDCPPATPYYDGKSCISCPATAPYFNLYYLKCEACPAPSTYANNDCVPSSSTVSTDPNIAKMYSTIF